MSRMIFIIGGRPGQTGTGKTKGVLHITGGYMVYSTTTFKYVLITNQMIYIGALDLDALHGSWLNLKQSNCEIHNNCFAAIYTVPVVVIQEDVLRNEALVEEYSVSAQVWKLNACDLCEIACISVYHISKSNTYQLLKPQLDIVLFEIIFPLMCLNDNDEKLWREDPHEYVRKGYDIIEDLYSSRTASIDFTTELVRKCGKENLQKFLTFIVEVFRRYDEAAPGYKKYRPKDGALLVVGALCDKLKQTEPYKSQLEQMLVQHVFPEFGSQVGHLRAKDEENLILLNKVVRGLLL